MYFKKRNKIFHLFYTNSQGQLRSISTKCTTKKDANQFAIKYFSYQEEEADQPKECTFKNFTVFYNGYAASRFSQSYKDFIEVTFKQFGRIIEPERLIANISILDIENFITMKRGEAGERIVNGYLRTLQSAFERALEFNMVNKNVFKSVKKLKAPSNPPLFLSKEELDIILSVTKDEKFRLIYRMGAYTGMRMGEMRFLRWKAIDFNRDLITVQNHELFTTKSKFSRDIPLHKCLRDDLLALKGEPDDYVFLYRGMQYTKNQLSKNFKGKVIASGLNEKFHFHTLRHTFASWLVQKGVSIYEVSKLLGHADIKTTEIYAHLKENNLRNSVNLL